MLALRTVLSSESRLLLLGFFYFRVWRKAGGEGNVQGRLPLPLPVFPGASSTVPLLASPLNFQAHIHSRVPLEGRSWNHFVCFCYHSKYQEFQRFFVGYLPPTSLSHGYVISPFRIWSFFVSESTLGNLAQVFSPLESLYTCLGSLTASWQGHSVDDFSDPSILIWFSPLQIFLYLSTSVFSGWRHCS